MNDGRGVSNWPPQEKLLSKNPALLGLTSKKVKDKNCF